MTLSWAKRHGLEVLTQDLTNPMLAQIAHAQLGAHGSPGMGLRPTPCSFIPTRPQTKPGCIPACINGWAGVSTSRQSAVPGLDTGFTRLIVNYSNPPHHGKDSGMNGTDPGSVVGTL